MLYKTNQKNPDISIYWLTSVNKQIDLYWLHRNLAGQFVIIDDMEVIKTKGKCDVLLLVVTVLLLLLLVLLHVNYL